MRAIAAALTPKPARNRRIFTKITLQFIEIYMF